MTGFDFISYQNIGNIGKGISTLKPTSSYLNTHKQRTLPRLWNVVGHCLCIKWMKPWPSVPGRSGSLAASAGVQPNCSNPETRINTRAIMWNLKEENGTFLTDFGGDVHSTSTPGALIILWYSMQFLANGPVNWASLVDWCGHSGGIWEKQILYLTVPCSKPRNGTFPNLYLFSSA